MFTIRNAIHVKRKQPTIDQHANRNKSQNTYPEGKKSGKSPYCNISFIENANKPGGKERTRELGMQQKGRSLSGAWMSSQRARCIICLQAWLLTAAFLCPTS
jgi:hypothetical protein